MDYIKKIKDYGYGKYLSTYSPILKKGIWCFKDEKMSLYIYELGFEYTTDTKCIIEYSNLSSVKSNLNIKLLSTAHKKNLKYLDMTFICQNGNCMNLKIPLAFYSSLLNYFVEKCTEKKS